MLFLKKYFTEGLIQMAILLSLCGVRVDVGLEPYLPPWREMILGPTSALTQTQFHNLRNRLEDGHGLHPKSVDLDGFFTARRLLGWVHSLDRLQVPQAELETWLVQREPDSLPVGFPDQTSPLVRATAELERHQTVPSVESRAALGNQQDEEEDEDKEEETHHVRHHSSDLDERGNEEEEQGEEEENLARMHGYYRRAVGERRPGGSYSRPNNRELTQNEIDQTSFSFEECLRLLEETFPFTEDQQLHDVGGRDGDLEHHSPDSEPMLPPIIPTGNPSLDMELHWQDLLAIMDPEHTDVDMMTSLDHTQNSELTGSLQGVRSEARRQNLNNPEDATTEAPLHSGLLGATGQTQPGLFSLTPSADLDDYNQALNKRDTFNDYNVNHLHSPPDHTDLLAEDPSEDLDLGLDAQDNSSNFNLNQLTYDLVESSPCAQHDPYPETVPGFDFNLNTHHLTPSTLISSLEDNDMTRNLLTSPSSVFLADQEDVANDDGLSSPLSDFLEDAVLDEFRLLDLALEEGFSPEMAARLEEEGYLDNNNGQQETGRDNDHFGSSTVITENQGQPRRPQQDGDIEADSDSGLSVDFSHSPASPCASEASSYSSSSSSSFVSADGSTFSEDEDEELVGSDMEVEVTIKQEEIEEELGAVGGYPEDVKQQLLPNYGDDKLFNGLPWLEHIGHDHTYNQPWSPASSQFLGKMPTKQTKSPLRHDNAKPYHRSSSRHVSQSRMLSRDERRARALKVPFSNELIIHLPVEEFNDLLANCQLSEEQLALIRDIRRRGKNKIAAQNCRKRKMDVLQGLNDDVTGLRHYRSRLLREKEEAQRKLKEMKRQLGMLYQDVFSRLRDDAGRPLDAMDYVLEFEPNGSVMVASRHQGTPLPQAKTKKQRDKKK